MNLCLVVLISLFFFLGWEITALIGIVILNIWEMPCVQGSSGINNRGFVIILTKTNKQTYVRSFCISNTNNNFRNHLIELIRLWHIVQVFADMSWPLDCLICLKNYWDLWSCCGLLKIASKCMWGLNQIFLYSYYGWKSSIWILSFVHHHANFNWPFQNIYPTNL